MGSDPWPRNSICCGKVEKEKKKMLSGKCSKLTVVIRYHPNVTLDVTHLGGLDATSLLFLTKVCNFNLIMRKKIR